MGSNMSKGKPSKKLFKTCVINPHRSILCSKHMKASPLAYFCYMICDDFFLQMTGVTETNGMCCKFTW